MGRQAGAGRQEQSGTGKQEQGEAGRGWGSGANLGSGCRKAPVGMEDEGLEGTRAGGRSAGKIPGPGHKTAGWAAVLEVARPTVCCPGRDTTIRT